MLTVNFRTLPLEEGDRVLDAGCGEGRHTFACFRHDCDVLGMDLSHQSLLKAKYVLGQMKKRNEARGRFLLLRGDALRFPFGDGSFDKIICAEVIEHVDDDRQGVAELARILSNGGKIAITVPTRMTEHVLFSTSRHSAASSRSTLPSGTSGAGAVSARTLMRFTFRSVRRAS